MSTKPTYIHGIILGAFCLGFGVVLAGTDMVTSAPIAQRALEDRYFQERSDKNKIAPSIVIRPQR